MRMGKCESRKSLFGSVNQHNFAELNERIKKAETKNSDLVMLLHKQATLDNNRTICDNREIFDYAMKEVRLLFQNINTRYILYVSN